MNLINPKPAGIPHHQQCCQHTHDDVVRSSLFIWSTLRDELTSFRESVSLKNSQAIAYDESFSLHSSSSERFIQRPLQHWNSLLFVRLNFKRENRETITSVANDVHHSPSERKRARNHNNNCSAMPERKKKAHE